MGAAPRLEVQRQARLTEGETQADRQEEQSCCRSVVDVEEELLAAERSLSSEQIFFGQFASPDGLRQPRHFEQ